MSTIRKAILQCKHPNSRKTLAITKQAKKSIKRDKQKMGHVIKISLLCEKLLWFKEKISDVTAPVLEKKHILQLIEKYLSRFDEELDEILLKNSIGARKNRQHASREDVIRMTINRERSEFKTCGIEVPNMLDAQQVALLKAWNGEPNDVQNFKIRRFNVKQLQ